MWKLSFILDSRYANNMLRSAIEPILREREENGGKTKGWLSLTSSPDPSWWPFGCQTSCHRIQQQFPSFAWINAFYLYQHLFYLVFECTMTVLFFFSLLRITALLIGLSWLPSALQFILKRPPQTLAYLSFSLLTIRLVVLSLACALKSLTFFFQSQVNSQVPFQTY